MTLPHALARSLAPATLRSLFAALMLLIAPALAQGQSAGAELEARLSPEEKRAIQDALVWSGDYDGGVDGVFGPGTRNAIKTFQNGKGLRPTGYLRQRHLDLLMIERARQTERFGWEVRRFPELGMDIGIPSRLFGKPEPIEIGLRFRSPPSQPKSELLLYSAAPMAPNRFVQLREEVVDRQRFSRDVYNEGGFEWFVFSGRSNDGIAQYTYIVNRDEGVRGFSFRYVDDASDDYARLNVAMYNSLKVRRAGAAQPTAKAAPVKPKVAEKTKVKPQPFRAQGVVVNNAGAVLTAARTAKYCKRPRVNDRFNATVTAIDEKAGLAVLTLEERDDGYPHLDIRTAPVSQRTDLEVAETLPGENRPKTDIERARYLGRKDRGDIYRFRVASPPLEGGSAGAALLDGDGRIAGVLGPFDPRAQDKDKKHQVRDVINAYAVMAFLAANGVEFGTASSEAERERVRRRATVVIGCRD